MPTTTAAWWANKNNWAHYFAQHQSETLTTVFGVTVHLRHWLANLLAPAALPPVSHRTSMFLQMLEKLLKL